jgi:hypothetical protein
MAVAYFKTVAENFSEVLKKLMIIISEDSDCQDQDSEQECKPLHHDLTSVIIFYPSCLHPPATG